MKIVVAMKQIPDLRQIRIKSRKPVLDDAPLTFGNIDKNALEAGIQLKEAAGGELIVVSAGTEDLEDTVKEALAAGADEAYLVIDDELENMESSTSACLIAQAIKEIGDVDILLFGEGSGDNYSGQVGSRVAALLGLPQVGYAQDIALSGRSITVTRALEDCEEVLEIELPAVVSVMADINEPRIPSVTQILKAGKKPINILELDVSSTNQLETLENLAPTTERKQIAVKTVEELIQALAADGLI